MAAVFKVGDLVWARMKGFPAWPGKVIEPKPEVKRPAKKGNFSFVFFFGSENYAWIPGDNVWSFHENKDKFNLNARAPKFFKEAVEAADESVAIDPLLPSNGTEPCDVLAPLPSIDDEIMQIFPERVVISAGDVEVTKEAVLAIKPKKQRAPRRQSDDGSTNVNTVTAPVALVASLSAKPRRRSGTKVAERPSARQKPDRAAVTSAAKKSNTPQPSPALPCAVVELAPLQTAGIPQIKSAASRKRSLPSTSPAAVRSGNGVAEGRRPGHVNQSLVQNAATPRRRQRPQVVSNVSEPSPRKRPRKGGSLLADSESATVLPAKPKVAARSTRPLAKASLAVALQPIAEGGSRVVALPAGHTLPSRRRAVGGSTRTRTNASGAHSRSRAQVALKAAASAADAVATLPALQDMHHGADLAHEVDLAASKETAPPSEAAATVLFQARAARSNYLTTTLPTGGRSERVGFLGLGVMGSGMARSLLRAGYQLTVWNRTSSKCEEFVRQGALFGETPADVVRQCDVTFSSVADPFAIKDLVFGDCGVLQAVTSGKMFVDMSTVDVDTAKDIAEAIAAQGGHYVEAPVLGGRAQADDGTLVILAAASSKDLVARCQAPFSALGKRTLYLGDVGNGARMKLCTSAVAGAAAAALAEGVSLAERVGLAPSDFLDALALAPTASPDAVAVSPRTSFSGYCSLFAGKARAMVESDFMVDFALKHQQKDLRLAIDMADMVDKPMAVTAAANELFKRAKCRGYGDLDVAAICKAARS